MRAIGLAGVIRGEPVRTTVSDKAAPCPLNRVEPQFPASEPKRLRVSDFTDAVTWSEFACSVFVIETYARRSIGWRASRTAHAAFILNTLEQALHHRRPLHRGGFTPILAGAASK
jgi:transposase InsO family protein